MKGSDLKRSRIVIICFMAALFISGITAIPIEWELSLLSNIFTEEGYLKSWLSKVYEAVRNTNASYPFLAYGNDWLAFAHILLTILFIGPLINPIKNKWIIQFGIIACILVIPFALIAGPFRQVPLFWQMIDCSFGLVGVLPLLWVLKMINSNIKI